ncbi:MAG: ABC transporter [Pirellula sp.]|nr:ABC transporter [Pirellula sp.]
MSNQRTSELHPAAATLPEPWAGHGPRLAANEHVRAVAEIDLAEDLRFQRRLLMLTGENLWTSPPEGSPRGDWEPLPTSDRATLAVHENGGIGVLRCVKKSGGQRHWRFTTARAAEIRRLVDSANRQLAGGGDDAEALEAVCPSCGAPLPSAGAVCASCAPKDDDSAATSTLWRLRQFAQPYAGRVALAFLLTVATTLASLVPPYLTMPLMDRVLVPMQEGRDVGFGLVWWYLSGLAVAAVAAMFLGWARTYVVAWVSERISADMRTRTYAHLQKLSLEFFGGKRTGDLMTRIGSDTDNLCTFLSLHALDFANDLLMIVLTACILISIDPMLALATLLPFPVIAVLVNSVRGKLRRGFDQSRRAWSRMTSVLADTIPGIRVVKAFAQEQREIDRFRKTNDQILHVNDRVNRTWSYFGPVVVLLTEVGLLVIWAFGAWQVSKHEITVGVLTAFLTYISRFYSRLDSMSRIVSVTQRAAAGAQRVFEILDRVPSVPEPVNPVHPGRVRGEVEFRDVGFRYGSRQVVGGVSFVVRPGEMIGLVGSSGAGKSTLVNLACRFYDVGEGGILVDGTDIRSFPVQEYRRNIGIVLQEPFLFFGTIAENIAYGKPDATREEIVAAARAAKAHEFILKLSEGYDSLVGERGQMLSGGERQRISIARALLIDPRILILDEATSSVDTETEREIQEALDNLIRGRTTIAIAHRLSTLRKANRLAVMERGRLVELGPEAELLAAGGAYARLYEAQRKLAADEGVPVSAESSAPAETFVLAGPQAR